MPVTIKQIAQASGFSVPTVSQVLNDKGHLYRPETRERIVAVARELGYRPNSYRWALRTGRFNNIGLLIPAAGGCLDGIDWRALANSLARLDMHLTVGTVGGTDPDDAASAPKMLREWSVDGLLIACGERFPADLRRLIDDHNIPAVDVGIERAGDCVYADEASALSQAVAELAGLGHRRLAWLHTRGDDRGGDGVQRALAETRAHRVKIEQIHAQRPLGAAERADACRKLLAGDHRPTAVIAGSAEDAVTLMFVAACQGLVLPTELSVIVLACRPVDALGIEVDRLGIDEAQLLDEAAQMLLRRVDKPGSTLPPRKLALRRFAGASVSAA